MLVGIQVVIQQVAAISQQLTELHDSLAQAIGKLRASIALLRAMVDAANELWGNAEFLLDKLHDDAASINPQELPFSSEHAYMHQNV